MTLPRRLYTHSWLLLSRGAVCIADSEWVVWAGGLAGLDTWGPGHVSLGTLSPPCTAWRLHLPENLILCTPSRIMLLTDIDSEAGFPSSWLATVHISVGLVFEGPYSLDWLKENSVMYGKMFLMVISLVAPFSIERPVPSPASPLPPFPPLPTSICVLSLLRGPVMVVADEMRLHLKRAMQGGVCSDTDGSSSNLKPYPLCSRNHLQASHLLSQFHSS